MLKKDKDAIYQWAAGLSDKQLEQEYYNGVMDCLGSEAEEMYERGYEASDIKEREKIEKYIQEKSHILEQLCEKRGIKLWESCATNKQGRWKGAGMGDYYCSLCGEKVTGNYLKQCPCCGAFMEEE